MSLRQAVVLAAMLVAFVACGAPPGSPSPSVASVSACSLVPEMDEAVGRTAVTPPSGFEVAGRNRCTWVYANDPARYVGITTGPRTNHDDAIGAFGPGEAVPGLGDDARWWPNTRTMSVAVGERSFQVDLQLDAAEATRELAVVIATHAVGRFGPG
jgi:hypothetical protein